MFIIEELIKIFDLEINVNGISCKATHQHYKLESKKC